MKKTKRRATSAGGKATATATVAQPAPQRSRRETLRMVRDWGGIGAIVAAGGWWLVSDVQAKRAEHDLSRLGSGVPTVVQIHDPNCPLCVALQTEVRAALRGFDDELVYLVANITTAEGRNLAAAHNVGNVTLLLFDGAGRRQDILMGSQTAAVLERRFRRLVDQDGAAAR